MDRILTWIVLIVLALLFSGFCLGISLALNYGCYNWIAPIFVGDDTIARAIYCKAT